MQVFLWILAALTTAAAGYFTYRADIKRLVPYPWLSALLRMVVVALVWLLLLAPSISITKKETQQPVVVFLQDESASIPPALKGDTATYRTEAQNLLAKLKSKFRVVTWGFGGGIQSDSLFHYRQPATDIAAALAQAQEFYGGQNLGAVVMATDGRFNQGIHPLFQSLALGSPLYSIALGDTALAKDLRIAQTYANRTAALNSQFELRADILALNCAGYNGNVQLSEGSTTLQSTPLSVNTARYDRSVSFTIKATTPGLHHYIIIAPAADGEQNISNNRRDVFIQVVEEKKSVLILAAAPHPDVNALREALAGLDAYNVTVKTVDAAPASFNDYQVVILHGLPSPGINLPALTGKPVWYILSGSSANAVPTSAGNINIRAGSSHDVAPTVNTSFSSFGLPQRIAVVADRLPPLSVPMGNITAGANTQVLFTQKSGALPLWLVQSGTVPQAVLAGEGIWRWRLYEYRYFHNHEVVDECIRQTVSALAANANTNPFRVELPKYEWSDGENITLNAYLLNATGEQTNTPDASLTIRDSAGKAQAFTFERSGNAYRLNMGLQPGGTYSYAAKTVYNGKAFNATGSFVVAGTPIELMETGADYPLLYNLSKKYSGAAFTRANMQAVYDSIANNQNIRPLIQTSEETLPLVDWKWYFFLILITAAAEWLLRKYWLAQ